MRIFRRPLEPWILRVLFALFICFWAGVPWQRSSTAQTLSSKAKESFERGKIAARQQAWDLALEYFEEAHEDAPKAPEVLYALGTTHDQVGHPIVAAVFLHAYLEAWPDAPNADRVQRKILELEVFTDRLARDLFREAFSAAMEVHSVAMERQSVMELEITNNVTEITIKKYYKGMQKLHSMFDEKYMVIKSMVEAGELGLARDFGQEYPSTLSQKLQIVALDITNRMREGRFVKDEPSPEDLFLLARELIDVIADQYAVRRRRIYHRGLLLIGFGVNLWNAGFKDWGLQNIYQGGDDVARSGLYDYDPGNNYGPGVSDYICLPFEEGFKFMDEKGTAVQVRFVGVESTRVYLRPGQQSHPEKKELPVISWLDVVRTGGVGDPWNFQLDDPAFVRLTSLIEKIESQAVEKIPRELAKLAKRLAVAHQFLKFNRP